MDGTGPKNAQHRSRRNAILRFAAAGTAAGIALVAAECLLAIFQPQWTWSRLARGQAEHFALLSVFEPCDYLPFRLKPNATDTLGSIDFSTPWRINRHGFREPDRALAKAPGERRILALGDSFTAGHGVAAEEAWPRVLERKLADGSSPARVINAGYACGYSPDCYYAYLRRAMDRLDPDVVVIALFAGNDVVEPMHHFDLEVDRYGLPLRVQAIDRWVDATGRRRLRAAARPWIYRTPVARNSHLCVLLATCLVGTAQPVSAPHSAHRNPYVPKVQAAYDRGLRSLLGTGRLAADHGAEVLIAILPDCVQLDPNVPHAAKDDPRLDLDQPQSRWLRDFANAGLAAIDLRERLADAVDRIRKVFGRSTTATTGT